MAWSWGLWSKRGKNNATFGMTLSEYKRLKGLKSQLAVKQSLEKLETLKKSLMQKYFGRGEMNYE